MITLYIASSLDGHIATIGGGLEWLESAGQGGEGGDYGYAAFYSTVDILVMGRKTWEIIKDWDPWPYPGKECWVVSRQPNQRSSHGERFTRFDPEDWQTKGQDQHVWLVGGGELVRVFLQHGLIDRIVWTILPRLLGEGVPLFPSRFPGSEWHLRTCESYPTGLVQLAYDRA